MRFQDVVKFVHEGIYRRNFVSVKEKLGKKKRPLGWTLLFCALRENHNYRGSVGWRIYCPCSVQSDSTPYNTVEYNFGARMFDCNQTLFNAIRQQPESFIIIQLGS